MRQNDPCKYAPSRAEIDQLHERKRRARAEAIDRLVADARDKGGCTDRMYWTIVHDFERADWTTNLQQLEEIGVCPPPPGDVGHQELSLVLWELIDALAGLGIYLIHTDHLSDRELYERLMLHVLREQVRDLPPDASVHEYIDLSPLLKRGREEDDEDGTLRDAAPASWHDAIHTPPSVDGRRDHLLPRPPSKSN
ncbi:MAG: hypothetical protein FJ256_05825 [Phycisphaerae bacterium]|nr:hypothetical protein [Phycisphaerae bacterium]